MRRTTVIVAAATLAVAGCGKSSKANSAPRDDAAVAHETSELPKPKLVVLVVIDQLPSWRFERDEPALSGGLRRLIDHGRYIPRAAYPYSATYTAPGHAALGSGASPETTGILANGWYDRKSKANVGAVSDPASPEFWINGEPPADGKPSGASARRLKVDGIGDALRKQTGGKGKSIAIGLKERATVVVLGRKPTLAVWYEPRQQALTTSSWYTAQPPAWLEKLAVDKPVSKYLEQVWTPRDEKRLAELAGSKDDGPGEGENYGLDTTFPHELAGNPEAAKAVRATPWGTQIVIDGALAAIEGEQLGADDVPDVLALTFSSHDYAGHYWGQESWERVELMLDLDRRLGEFLDELDRRVGKDQYAVVVSSDHGAEPLVETSVAHGHRAKRVHVDEIVDAANSAAAGVLGAGVWVDEFAASTLYCTDAFRSRPADKQQAALDAIVAAVSRVDGISYAARCDRIAGKCDAREGMDALACRSIQLGESGDVFVNPDRYSLTTTTYDTGTSHGTGSTEDRVVPIIIYAPGMKPKRATTEASTLQVAPTLAKLLGIDPPPAATAEPLL